MNPALQFLAALTTAALVLLSFMLFVTMRQSVRVAGSKQWRWGVIMVVVGIVLGAVAQTLPDWLGRIPSNTLMLAGWLQVAYGTYTYRTHKAPSLLPVMALGAVCLLLFGTLSYLYPHYSARVVVFTSLQFCIFAFHAWAALLGGVTQRRAPWVHNRNMAAGHWLLLLSATCIMLNVALRGADAARNFTAALPVSGPDPTVVNSYAIGVFLWLSVFVSLMLIMTAELELELRKLANTDALSKALNRRGLAEAVTRLPKRKGQEQVHSLLSFDLDHFKAINDEFGHEAGDQVIELFVTCARRMLPASAIIARTGGEEFCIVLPNMSQADASAAAGRLRAEFTEQSAQLNHGRNHSASAGLVSVAAGQFALAELQRRADQALYRAKQNGRDQVVQA